MQRQSIIVDIETSGLSPLNDRIVAIGVKKGKEGMIITDKDEGNLLAQFWGYLKEQGHYRLISFNGYQFDIPFIIIRSFKHNVIVEQISQKTIDLRLILANGNKYAKGTLDDYAKLMGIKSKLEGMGGSDIPILWEEGKIAEIKAYLQEDLRITSKIFERCEEIGLI